MGCTDVCNVRSISLYLKMLKVFTSHQKLLVSRAYLIFVHYLISLYLNHKIISFVVIEGSRLLNGLRGDDSSDSADFYGFKYMHVFDLCSPFVALLLV